MLSRSFFPNFGQGSFPKIAGKGPEYVATNGCHRHNIATVGLLYRKKVHLVDKILKSPYFLSTDSTHFTLILFLELCPTCSSKATCMSAEIIF